MGEIGHLEERREEIINVPAGDEIRVLRKVVFFVEHGKFFDRLVSGHHNLELFEIGCPFHHIVHLMDAMVAAGTKKYENDGYVLLKALAPELSVAHGLKLERRDVGMLFERWNLLLRKCL